VSSVDPLASRPEEVIRQAIEQFEPMVTDVRWSVADQGRAAQVIEAARAALGVLVADRDALQARKETQ